MCGKKLKTALLVALIVLAPAEILAGGFPSQPKFLNTEINTQAGNPNAKRWLNTTGTNSLLFQTLADDGTLGDNWLEVDRNASVSGRKYPSKEIFRAWRSDAVNFAQFDITAIDLAFETLAGNTLAGELAFQILHRSADPAADRVLYVGEGEQSLLSLFKINNPSDTSVSPCISGAPVGAVCITTGTNQPISIGTGATERMRIAGDGSSINLKATSVQVNGTQIPAYADTTANFTGTLQSKGVDITASAGSFTLTVTAGCGGSPTLTAHYSKIGHSVTATFDSGLHCGSSPGTSWTMSGWPAALLPTQSAAYSVVPCIDNTVSTMCVLGVLNSGIAVLNKYGGGASLTDVLNFASIAYLIE